MKFSTSNLHSFPPDLDYVASLTWEVKSPNLLKITKDTTQKWYFNCTVCHKNETLHVIWLKGY